MYANPPAVRGAEALMMFRFITVPAFTPASGMNTGVVFAKTTVPLGMGVGVGVGVKVSVMVGVTVGVEVTTVRLVVGV
jgi:hypothetical protein